MTTCAFRRLLLVTILAATLAGGCRGTDSDRSAVHLATLTPSAAPEPAPPAPGAPPPAPQPPSTGGTVPAAPPPPPAPAPGTPAPPDPARIAVTAERVAAGFTQPLLITHAGDGSGRIFIVEKTGA